MSVAAGLADVRQTAAHTPTTSISFEKLPPTFLAPPLCSLIDGYPITVGVGLGLGVLVGVRVGVDVGVGGTSKATLNS